MVVKQKMAASDSLILAKNKEINLVPPILWQKSDVLYFHFHFGLSLLFLITNIQFLNLCPRKVVILGDLYLSGEFSASQAK